jgi:hypothetical protein
MSFEIRYIVTSADGAQRRGYNDSRFNVLTIHETLRLRFEIFCLLCLLKPGSAIPATA